MYYMHEQSEKYNGHLYIPKKSESDSHNFLKIKYKIYVNLFHKRKQKCFYIFIKDFAY